MVFALAAIASEMIIKDGKMHLFDVEEIVNVLPYDGVATYYGKVLHQKEPAQYFEQLSRTIDWKNDKVVIFGKLFITKRKVAWYGDVGYSYTYSNTTKQALRWTD